MAEKAPLWLEQLGMITLTRTGYWSEVHDTPSVQYYKQVFKKAKRERERHRKRKMENVHHSAR